ncbi:MAG: 1-deoxy-D-xylulose-5-phosphate synthase [Bacteroides sp.]|nr:1-deoxy-D-xylulose-5-phosphate synthase [Prevotella sp.]MCM1469838.1 1-deoxy-D-xylulose-5-phosphate synthase [Bacteroides sp.]
MKKLSYSQLAVLASEMREKILTVVGTNGGHLSSNLGVVELTIALHRVFDSPKDAIIWDVSHQCYAHKLLTGRYQRFHTLRRRGGIAGFTRHEESAHDYFDAGHSSTSISSALGLLTGRSLLRKDGKVIAVIGDGALTGGMAFEALSHAGQIAKNLIVILNDNQLSIGKNTGSLSKYLSRLTVSAPYQSFRHYFDRIVERIPGINTHLSKLIFRLKRGIKGMFLSNNLFVDLGYEYVGPLNGHSIEELERVLRRVKKICRPVVVHVVTQKGKGYTPAEHDPVRFHGIGPFCISDGTAEIQNTLNFTEVFSQAVVELAGKNPRIAAITAAMTKGTGLTEFASRYPERFFDVGIAEQHAVTFAGGLAVAGMKPIVAIYSTFMQRAVDQLIQDIAIQNVPAVFVLDRAGAVPDDGETHQGIFDIALLRPVPNMSLIAPASAEELRGALDWAACQNVPAVIRYPKNCCPAEQQCFSEPFVCGRGVLIRHAAFGMEACLSSDSKPVCASDGFFRNADGDADILYVCTGGIYPEVFGAAGILCAQGIRTDIYNLRFLKPLDKDYFLEIVRPYDAIVFVEDGIRIGGIGTYLESLLQRTYTGKKTAVCGFPDRFIAQGKRADILDDAHLSDNHLIRKARQLLDGSVSAVRQHAEKETAYEKI